MNNLNLSAPWYTYQKKLAAIFAHDDDVTVGPVTGVDGVELAVEVGVTNRAKADALGKLLRRSVQFGGVNMTVAVVELPGGDPLVEAAKTAFAHNRAVQAVEHVEGTAGFERTYVVFRPSLIQFFNDDLDDYRGNFNSLAEDVAREIFAEDAALSYCTAVKDKKK